MNEGISGSTSPITCLACSFDNGRLCAGDLETWTDYSKFERALRRAGPWIAGIDFPFGQARRFVEGIGWPSDWQKYVSYVGSLEPNTFRAELDAYRRARSPGDKEHRRATDIGAGSISPQKLYGVPVGLMFYEGAPRIAAAGVTIPHLLEGDPTRIVVEAYPGIVARSLIGRSGYKQDTRKKQSNDQREARLRIFAALRNGDAEQLYGFRVEASSALCDDPAGDHLDALLCAVQAAWAWNNKTDGFGAPETVDRLEGWIADPHLRGNSLRDAQLATE